MSNILQCAGACRVETTTPSLQLVAHHQAAAVEQLPKDHCVVYQSLRYQTDANYNVPDCFSPNAEAEPDLIPMLTDSMGIIPCAEVTLADFEPTLMRKTYVCPQNVV